MIAAYYRRNAILFVGNAKKIVVKTGKRDKRMGENQRIRVLYANSIKSRYKIWNIHAKFQKEFQVIFHYFIINH